MSRLTPHSLAAAFGLASCVALAACGGGAPGPAAEPGGAPNRPSAGAASPSPASAADTGIPAQLAHRATQAPVLAVGGSLHVGADVAPPASGLDDRGNLHGVSVSSGTVQDGVGAARVLDFLRQYVQPEGRTDGLATYPNPPIVRLAAGTDAQFAELTVRALQAINAALPPGKRVSLDPRPAPPLAGLDDVPDGEIFIDFAPWADWNFPGKSPRGTVAGTAQTDHAWRQDPVSRKSVIQQARASRVWIDTDIVLRAKVYDTATRQWTRTILAERLDDTGTRVMAYTEDNTIQLIAHELLHALGFRSHPTAPRFDDSTIMNNEDRRRRTVRAVTPHGTWTLRFDHGNHVPGHILFPADRETLLAAHARLEPGTLQDELSPHSLGPWTDTSFHLRGEIAHSGGPTSFGVASRNGLAQPWASGPLPATPLGANPALKRTATWNGALLGVTPETETVAGKARLDMALDHLQGSLAFTALEKWPAGAPPGQPGSGDAWTHGRLRYAVEVRGNTFVRTSGDDGALTGAFFGPRHEAMGGVLERCDLTAAFGGKR